MALFSRKPTGFLHYTREKFMREPAHACQAAMCIFDFANEKDRQQILLLHRKVVEAALDSSIPEDLRERTIFLEEVVANMKLVKLTMLDRMLLTSIGNLLIDSAIRKGRPLAELIPPRELEQMRGKAIQYKRYCHGKF